MNIKELANKIDGNVEKIKALYYSTKKNEENEDKRRVLFDELSFLFHSLDLYQGHDPATITRQYEIISQVSALFIEINKLLIQ